MNVQSPVCVATHVREWDVPQLPAGAILEMDEGVEVRSTQTFGNGVTRYQMVTAATQNYYANVRLGANGPILQSIPIRTMTVRDAEDTSIRFVDNFGDGSYQVDMAAVAAPMHDDVFVRWFIFIAGTTFEDGTLIKDYYAEEFDELGQANVSFIKTSLDGSACHRTSIWQGDKRIALFY